MTTTIAILSIVIIVLCGALIWMYFFGSALQKELSSRPIIIDDVRVLRDEINRLQKELDFVRDTGNRKEGESIGVPYSKIDLTLEPSEESRKKFMDLLDDSKNEIIEGVKLTGVSMTENGLECEYIINNPQPPEDRIFNQAKKPVPPKPRKTVITTEDKPTTSTKVR